MSRLRNMIGMSTLTLVILAMGTGELLAQGSSKRKPFNQVLPPEPSPLLVEPKTPEEFFASSLLMIDLARPDLAKVYLDEFEKGSPDDDLLLKLRDKHGTGEFLKLSLVKELQPFSANLLKRLSDLGRKQSESPEFVDDLISKLFAGPTERELAIRELRNAGPRAVPQIFKQMSREDMKDKQDSLVVALVRMGRQVVPPVLGALDSPLDRVRAAAISVVGQLDATESVPFLWFPAFSESQPQGTRNAALQTLAKLTAGKAERTDRVSSVTAANELRRLSKLLYRKNDLLIRDDNGDVTIWVWDVEQGTVVPKTYTPDVAALLMSTRFARQSLGLSPEQLEPQRQYLSSLLGLDVLQRGWDFPREPAPGTPQYLALTAGEEIVSQVLADAMEAGQPATAVSALEVLSQIGTREQLITKSGVKSPVLASLNAPDHRTQFAAAMAVLRMEPRTAFPQANRVVSILSRALSDPGQPRAIVIDADNGRATNVVGFLSEAGYQGVAAATGREGFERSATLAGVDLIVVHDNCQRWDLTQTLSNIRSDARTAAIPVVVYGQEAHRAELARLVGRSSPATFANEVPTSADFLQQVDPFLKRLKSPPLSANERNQQKLAAAYWLANIVSNRSTKVFDVAQAEKDLGLVADSPEAGPNALIALGGISTGTAQKRLSEVALAPAVEPALREAAATQLGYHIQRFGLLLTKDTVADLHTGWVAAKEPGLKSALATVMGNLRPNATLVGDRLQKFDPATPVVPIAP